MHLKSLTLKGFKSFATPTTLRFEPGITCVVGPNGSGKSNVVDAIAWVLGEQGAKSLRGGKMEDVIFGGAPGRPALGRAEVTLTIDNTDGALPIEYAEVSVRRLMFRSGESEYAINGQRCRLVDVQELLSDSGIGRELHVVVGQGQLDAVLQARPEDRRGFIEEAAGVLKHRKRKEKALRKLDAMQANLTRLTDLTAELRRQLKPLGRQAEVARRAATVQADLRDARLRLLADDVLALRTELDAEVRDEEVLRERRAEVENQHTALLQREAELEAAAADQAPRLARATETWYRLSALEERLRGTASLAAERSRHLAAVETDDQLGRDPAELDAEALAVREQEAALAAARAADDVALRDAVTRRTDLEAALATEENALVAAARAVADRREGLARLHGQVEALRTRSEAADAEVARLATSLAEVNDRAAAASGEVEELQGQAAELDASRGDLDARHEAAAATLAALQDTLAGLHAQERDAEGERVAWQARREALSLSLARKDGAGRLLEAGGSALLGSVAALVQVRAGYEGALAAALGALADAVAVSSPAAAAAGMARLRSEDAGRAGFVVGSGSSDPEPSYDGPGLPPGAQWALDLVVVPPALRGVLARTLATTVVVQDLDSAQALVESQPQLRAVTREGDLLGSDWAAGGSAGVPSLLEVQAAVEEAAAEAEAAAHRQERLRFSLSAAQAELDAAQVELDESLAALHESDARMAALGEQLQRVHDLLRAAETESARLEQAHAHSEEVRDEATTRLAELEDRLARAADVSAEGLADGPATELRDQLALDAQEARAAEVEARLALRTGEERMRALAGRAEALERAARQQREARARIVQRREERAAAAEVALQVRAGALQALERLAISLVAAGAEREAASTARSATEAELATLRVRTRELATELEALTDVVHRDEVARVEQRARIEMLELRAVDEWGVPATELISEYGPDVPVPVEDGEPVPFDRHAQERRAAAAERALALLGRVNPLALEEYSALEERSAFLTTQLEDLKATRRDLLTVVRDVDERITEVFRSAFEDTAREFGAVFATLFPGGEGKLVLTEPDDLLTTGIEVMARPAGKRISRLSLLSGGERSLTAIALLVAIFRARPSPFYVLDEVEAALDDRNPGRLLELLEGLRQTSQLVVITHQKRTMEIADALYGVTMAGDGVSAVVSQRLRELESA
ncbi:MAG TPA: chromosome segregation protein SMC [Mycobacteriales bacterium]|nr:chromosome segregation protein SMC [Mycobacteriales bacterium]